MSADALIAVVKYRLRHAHENAALHGYRLRFHKL